ncbi:MAG TPA: sigma-70 family RNA polymerase sigma factor [Bryobacteraceae bacterium]|nr:sigma-70 family RNA polymerase sigma factor [Bryobacteraceae bacterium]
MPGSSSDSTFVISAAVTPVAADRLEDEVVGLFEQLRSRMLRYLLSLGLPAHDAEEVVQEVFLSLFQHLQRGKGRENLRGWVFRVAHNLALKQRTLSRREFQYSAETVETVDPQPNPEEKLAGSQRQQRLLAVMRALPEQDQYCLYLRAEGLRYREIAEVLGISLGAVSNSLVRSLGRLGRADER